MRQQNKAANLTTELQQRRFSKYIGFLSKSADCNFSLVIFLIIIITTRVEIRSGIYLFAIKAGARVKAEV